MSDNKLTPLEAAGKAKSHFLRVTDESAWAREIMFVKQALMGNSALGNCTRESIEISVINVALTGLTLNPKLALAYLVPRKGQCCLDISYKGLIYCAIKSGAAYSICATVVKEKDVITLMLGTNPDVHHSPCLEKDRGETIGVYVVSETLKGVKQVLWVSREELDAIQKISPSSNGPWKTFPDEMRKKAAIKRAVKTLPQNPQLAETIALLNDNEGIDFTKRSFEPRDNKALADQFKKQGELTGAPDRTAKLVALLSELGVTGHDDMLEWVGNDLAIEDGSLDALSDHELQEAEDHAEIVLNERSADASL